MVDYCNSVFVYYVIYVFNFCETFYNSTVRYVSSKINERLEGRVLYYAMYTKGTQGGYYTQLYDLTSVFDKLKLIFLSYLHNDYFSNNSVFTFNEVNSNIENLTSFRIDAVIVSYIKDGGLTTQILSYKDNNSYVDNTADTASSRKTKFVYAVLVSQHGEEYDFTKELNNHLNDMKNSPLLIKDFIHIINIKYSKNLYDEHNFKLKVMTDNDFDEVVYNGDDKVEI